MLDQYKYFSWPATSAHFNAHIDWPCSKVNWQVRSNPGCPWPRTKPYFSYFFLYGLVQFSWSTMTASGGVINNVWFLRPFRFESPTGGSEVARLHRKSWIDMVAVVPSSGLEHRALLFTQWGGALGVRGRQSTPKSLHRLTRKDLGTVKIRYI